MTLGMGFNLKFILQTGLSRDEQYRLERSQQRQRPQTALETPDGPAAQLAPRRRRRQWRLRLNRIRLQLDGIARSQGHRELQQQSAIAEHQVAEEGVAGRSHFGR